MLISTKRTTQRLDERPPRPVVSKQQHGADRQPRPGSDLFRFRPNFPRVTVHGFDSINSTVASPPSSRGLGHLPFTEATGVRIPLGVLIKTVEFVTNQIVIFRLL
jgi:hypothetical protein